MKNIFTGTIIGVFILTLMGCQPASRTSETAETTPSTQPNLTTMTEAEAKVIAQETCIKGGESLAPGFYNENTKTWWFDANLNTVKEGCNPACVVSEESKKAEINWRCTGLIPPAKPTDSPVSEALRELFAKKYPKYAKTISVQIDKESENHVRGSVTFATGAPGGIFLAVKEDGNWKIVHDGNGQILCTLSEYDFPPDMLLDCAKVPIE